MSLRKLFLSFFLPILFFPLSAHGQQTRVYGTREVPTVDTTVVELTEEFVPSRTAIGLIATHGWGISSIGGVPILTNLNGAVPNLGILNVQTPAVITQGGNLALSDGAANAFLGVLSANGNWDSSWVFQINQNTNIRFRIGYEPGTVVVAQPIDGLWLRFDTSAGFADANWQFCARAAAAAETCYDTGVAPNLNFHNVRIRSGNAGVIYFSLDGGTERSICPAGCDANGHCRQSHLPPA